MARPDPVGPHIEGGHNELLPVLKTLRLGVFMEPGR